MLSPVALWALRNAANTTHIFQKLAFHHRAAIDPVLLLPPVETRNIKVLVLAYSFIFSSFAVCLVPEPQEHVTFFSTDPCFNFLLSVPGHNEPSALVFKKRPQKVWYSFHMKIYDNITNTLIAQFPCNDLASSDLTQGAAKPVHEGDETHETKGCNPTLDHPAFVVAQVPTGSDALCS